MPQAELIRLAERTSAVPYTASRRLSLLELDKFAANNSTST